MAEPRYALTLKTKGQKSDLKLNPLVRVLTFAMSMGCESVIRPAWVCMSIRRHISLVFHQVPDHQCRDVQE